MKYGTINGIFNVTKKQINKQKATNDGSSVVVSRH